MSHITQSSSGYEETFKHAHVNTGSIEFLKCMVFNSQSINNKYMNLMEHVMDFDTDVLFISETWLKSNKNSVTASFSDYGYKLHHNIRKDRRKELGGGVGILVKTTLDVKPIKVKQFLSFEHCIVKLHMKDGWRTLISIYRLDYEPVKVFFNEFTELLETVATSNDKFIIAGDINIHCDVVNDRVTVQLNDLLQMFNLVQVVDSPTHRAGHTLDIVITRSDEEISQVEVSDISLSDHFLISFLTDCKIKRTFYETRTYRNIKRVDMDNFTNDLAEVIQDIPTNRSLGVVVGDYNVKMANLIDRHAPKVTKEFKIVPSAPWFDMEYKELRKERRKAEKKYKRSGNCDDKEAFKCFRKQTTELALLKKRQYYTEKIDNAQNKPKELFKIVNRLRDVKQECGLPSASSNDELANKFLVYFKDKIVKIRDSFTTNSEFNTAPELVPEDGLLNAFEPATDDELRTIILSYGVSCSPEDPIPVGLLKQNIDLLLPFWLQVVNLSLSTGSMDCLKSAVVIPLLKELDEFIDTEILKNYRPVSNLLFLSKLIERCVASRLDKHLKDNDLESRYQYGYKKGHSTELLLVNLVNNVLNAFDNKLATVLLLLDLSAAFDTVDQDKLLNILHHEIGIGGTAYKWFVSFLKGRSQKVMIKDTFSNWDSLDFGVAQGSILGPKLFNIYTRSFYPHVHISSFEVDGYADDHQLYKFFVVVHQAIALGSAINECLRNVSSWMSSYFLKLNKSKTKILVLAPPSLMSSIDIHGAFLDEGCVRFVDCAKNLGVWIDQNLNLKTQTQKVVSSCYMTLREISKIKSFLPKEALNTLVASLVLSKLDYCNALYFNIGSHEINMLQSVQNSAIRMIFGRFKYDRKSISHLFIKIHWLKIRERIIFKICLIVHKCIWNIAPESLKSLIVISNTRTYLLVEKKFYSVYGERAFSRSGPKLWNNLPLHVRMESNIANFKKLLKSFLMTDHHAFYTRLNSR